MQLALRAGITAVSWRKAAAAPAVVTGTGRGLGGIHDVTSLLTRTMHPVTEVQNEIGQLDEKVITAQLRKCLPIRDLFCFCFL